MAGTVQDPVLQQVISLTQPRWKDQAQANGLWNVTVKVTRQRANGTTFDCSISQMVLDPSVVGSTQDSLAINVGTAPSTTGSGTTGATDATGAVGAVGAPAGKTGAMTPAKGGTGKATTPTTKKGS